MSEPESEVVVGTDAQLAWFYIEAGQQCGPVSDDELVRLCASGQVTGSTLVWRQGFAEWLPLAHLNARIPMAAGAGVATLTYAQGEDDPTNIFGWWWRVVRYSYADFRGRARRKEYWSFVVVNTLLMLGIGIPAVLLSRASPAASVLGGVLMIATLAVYLFSVLPTLGAAVRRLHDSGRSGWWFFTGFVPYIGGLILFILLCMDSEAETNAYGPNPKSAVRGHI